MSLNKIANAAACAKVKLYLSSEFETYLADTEPYAWIIYGKLETPNYAQIWVLRLCLLKAFSEWRFTFSTAGVNVPEPGQFQFFSDFNVDLTGTSLTDVNKVLACNQGPRFLAWQNFG